MPDSLRRPAEEPPVPNVRVPNVRSPDAATPGDSEFARIDREAGREMARARRTVWLSLLMGAGIGMLLILWAILGRSLDSETQLLFGVLVGVEATAMGFLLAYYVHTTQVRVMERYLNQVRRLALRLQDLSTRDSLTGLHNHGYLLTRIEEEISLARRHARSLSIIILDLDNFKDVNDRHGHLVGDEVLRRIAQAIQQRVRQHDVVGRYGGDEFCIIMPQTDKLGALATVEKLLEAMDELSVELRGWTDGTTFSSGVCTYPEDGRSVHTLIAYADSLLYREKQEVRAAQTAVAPAAPPTPPAPLEGSA